MGFKNILDKAYPFLSAALSIGGPAGTIASSLIGKAIGIDKIEPTIDAVNQALASHADPEIVLKLKQVEEDFAFKMKELNINSVQDLINADNEDRENARAREIAVRDHTPKIIAFVVVGITLIFEGYTLFHGLPKDTDGVIIGRVLGTLDSALIMVLAYYFGSSAGSDAQRKTIADIAKS